jgi:hypothetical protein
MIENSMLDIIIINDINAQQQPNQDDDTPPVTQNIP